MADPPSLPGALKATEACALPPVAVPIVGAPGTVDGLDGVAEFDAADSALLPTALVAWTVNVYGVPFDRPVTVRGELAPEAVKPPGVEIAV
jgi:hypothetical protein